MRRFLWHIVIFGVVYPLVWALLVGFLLHSADGEGVIGSMLSACGLMLSVDFLILFLCIGSAFFHYAICASLDPLFARFFRFDIIALGGIWGAGTAQIFKPLFAAAGVNVSVIIAMGTAIGLVTGFFAARLAPNRCDVSQIPVMNRTRIILLLFVVSVFSFLLGDWYSTNVFRQKVWVKQKEQAVRNHLRLYRHAKDGNSDRVASSLAGLLYSDLMELKYYNLSGEIDDSLMAEAQVIASKFQEGLVNIKDVIPGESPKIIKIIRE